MKAHYLTICLLAGLTLLSTAVSLADNEKTTSDLDTPDNRTYKRPLTSEDLAVARRKQRVVPSQIPQPNFNLLKLTDVNNIDFSNGSEPSLAVDPDNPNIIVIHAGFGGWSPSGKNNSSLYVSKNSGTSWSRVASINPPPNGSVCNPANRCGPNDTTLAYGGNSLLFGSFLGEGFLFTGDTANPSAVASFQWRTVFNNAQPTEQIATHKNDQPWVVIHNHPPDSIVVGRQRNIILPVVRQNDVYVAYNDFVDSSCSAVVPVRVAVSPKGANPPNFIVDRQVGTRGSGCVNPGHRLAVAPKTIFRDGTQASGFVYSLHQHCADCSAKQPLFDIMLNRTTNRGNTWSLNDNPDGIVVDQASSQQPSPKFGDVNALFGGIDHLAVDPSNGLVYVVYGVFDPAVGHNRLAIRRLFYQKCNEFSACNVLVADRDSRVFVDDGKFPAALPSVAVATNGTVGVLYDTFEGTIGRCDDGNGIQKPCPVFVTHLALTDGRQGDLTFTTHSLLAFRSPASNNGDDGQRVLGDYQQMIAVGNKFYGVFTGTGAAFGRSSVSNDPIFFIADVSNLASSATDKLLKSKR